jgi:hemolysin III
MTVPEDAIPRLRGVLHAYAFWFAVAAAIVLFATAPDGRARIAAAIYGVALCGLFAASATYHRWRRDPRWKPMLRRIDHSMIFVFIAASYTPVALLVLSSTVSLIVLLSVWIGALAGVAFSLAWIDAPRVVTAVAYIGVGWVIVIAAPDVVDGIGLLAALLFLLGGLLYSTGATVYALQRPNPWPQVFGFHEVFHALVIAAALAHFVAMAGWVIPHGSQ